jgi:hypothetical protein
MVAAQILGKGVEARSELVSNELDASIPIRPHGKSDARSL